jgi:hypothetical protein
VKNLAPDRVARIEVIRNPSGRYHTEGYTSVINIVLKKNYKGFDSSLEEEHLYSLDQSYGNDQLFRRTSTADLTYTYKKVNVYGSYSNSKSNTNIRTSSHVELDGISLNQLTTSDDPNSLRDDFNHSVILGSDIFINPTQSVSFEASMVQSPFDKNKLTRTYNNEYITSDLHESFVSQLSSNNSNHAYYTLLSYRNNGSGKNKLEFDGGYNNFESRQINIYQEIPGAGTDQENSTRREELFLDLNYKRVFNKVYSLELGYKSNYKTSKYNNPEILTGEDTKDLRNLGYAYLSITPESKLKVKTGMALERTTLKVSGHSNDYHSLQPFLSLFYQHSSDMSIAFKLNSKSQYPYFNQLNPFEVINSRLTKEVGNLDLRFSTQYTSFLDVRLFKNRLNIEPFYSIIRNYISRTGEVINDQFRYSYSNIDDYKSMGFNIGTKLTLIPKKMFFGCTGTFYHDRTDFNGHSNSVSDVKINSNLIYLSSKHKTLYALILKKMNTKSVTAYGYESNNNDYLACFIKQPFYKRKLTVSLLYLLPVETGLSYTMSERLNDGSFEESTHMNINLLTNLFMVKLSFKLNKGNEVKVLKKKDYKEKKPSKGFI